MQTVRKFEEIWEIASKRKGGDAALTALLSYPKTQSELEAVPDDRWLSRASQGVFNAGFNWKVVEAKWPGFEAAFHGFDLDKVANMHPEELDALMNNKDVIRNGMKLRSVQDNALFLQELRSEFGSVGSFFAMSPPENFVELIEVLKKRGSRLGGNTGMYFMRAMGVDGFILGNDGVARLIAEGVVDKPPTSKGAMRQVQEVYNLWMGQSGRSLTEISRVLAMSV